MLYNASAHRPGICAIECMASLFPSAFDEVSSTEVRLRIAAGEWEHLVPAPNVELVGAIYRAKAS